ncbi:hypothetical protein B7494_g2277 [Chlorociboria aeruginascens]|nr:hypothetical protein B7494_g2277 [Chlorociboria aeruginascens]
MSSTRETSREAESLPSSPSQLTPRSKVKAMLAALDGDSDDENTSGSSGAKLLPTISKSTTPKSSNKTPQLFNEAIENQTAGELEDNGREEDDEDKEEDIMRPKGRLASRMQTNDEHSDEDEDHATDNARERVRRMLMTKSKPPTPVDIGDPETADENDSPVAARKRRIRVPRNRSTPTSGSASPPLFISPTSQKYSAPDDASDSDDLPKNPAAGDRFKALVEKKRQERREKEAEITREKARKAAERKRQTALVDEDDLDVSDGENGRRLTQQARPTRKASKKALEEMHRETQRLSRNMQLAHQAKTKKKITKASLFAKFNYKPTEDDSAEVTYPTSSSSAHDSDIEMHSTPPTSPASHENSVEKGAGDLDTSAISTVLGLLVSDEDLPNLGDALVRMPSSSTRIDKGKGKAIEEEPIVQLSEKKPKFTQRPIRVRPPKVADRVQVFAYDSDSDLEIVSSKTTAQKTKLDSIFDRVPVKNAKESKSLHALRMLAHLTSPGKQNLDKSKNPSMTSTDLHLSLQQRAREQATREREERLQALRDKGVIVQTAEEREKEMAEVEDLISKARREGEEIMKREKAAAKKERKKNGEIDPLGESSDDEEWDEEKEDFTKQLSGSGSEDDEANASEREDSEEDEENDDKMSMDGEENLVAIKNHMFDREAAETEDDGAEESASDEQEEADDEDENEENEMLPIQKRRARNTNVISDEEDEGDDEKVIPTLPPTDSPVQIHTDSSGAPTSVLRSATKTFIPGLTVAGPAGLGLTQIFAGTMDDSQIEPHEASPMARTKITTRQDSMDFLRGIPAPELPPFVPTMEEDSQDIVIDSQSHVPESQPQESMTQGFQFQFNQSQVHGFDSLVDSFATQVSDFPEATQDLGFQHMTPIKGRFIEPPPSTTATVIVEPTQLPEIMEESPILKRKSRLRQRARIASVSDEEDAEEPTVASSEDEFKISANVFDVMRKASKKQKVVVNEFDKKSSKAKDMVNEQAEESEDEYAGLGGASDDESGDEEDAYVKEIIDDEGGKDVDESKLAAFFADRERENDEKQVEKLYKDITNGMLRRKRGADYDLSDSDDGGEARQRMKRKKFAKMRKALLADVRIAQIAENPKRQAFLRSIEDRGSGDEMDFLDDFAEQEETLDSQSQSESSQQRIPDSQPTVMGPPKRKHADDAPSARPPPHLRRTRPFRKPSNIAEIRESLSSLIESPNPILIPVDSGSDTDDELEIEGAPDSENAMREKGSEKENRDPFALRRSNIPIIDRISLKRANSNSTSANTRLAFATSSQGTGFKVPPLLRRATTNSSIVSGGSSASSAGMERMVGGSSEGGVRRGGGKNSGVNYFARESERRVTVLKTEKRRERKIAKGAEGRRKVVGSLFGGGKFE